MNGQSACWNATNHALTLRFTSSPQVISPLRPTPVAFRLFYGVPSIWLNKWPRAIGMCFFLCASLFCAVTSARSHLTIFVCPVFPPTVSSSHSTGSRVDSLDEISRDCKQAGKMTTTQYFSIISNTALKQKRILPTFGSRHDARIYKPPK